MPRPSRSAFLLLVLAVVATTLAATSSTAAVDPAATSLTEGRTWVVDAVDDTASNRWESVDTGGPTVTIAVGDTVEWQFDRATQGHDLVSLAPDDPWETVWEPALQEYRDAGGEPVRYTFTEPGTYQYECSLHGAMMSGTVVVVAPSFMSVRLDRVFERCADARVVQVDVDEPWWRDAIALPLEWVNLAVAETVRRDC